jgi:hypothetical protein
MEHIVVFSCRTPVILPLSSWILPSLLYLYNPLTRTNCMDASSPVLPSWVDRASCPFVKSRYRSNILFILRSTLMYLPVAPQSYFHSTLPLHSCTCLLIYLHMILQSGPNRIEASSPVLPPRVDRASYPFVKSRQ